MICVLAWRVLWLTTVNRTSPALPASLVFTDVETKLLERLVPEADASEERTVGRFLTLLGRLGGYLNRRGDHRRQHGPVARHGQADRHPPRLLHGPRRCG
jgi:hypothetical protein